MGGIIVDKRVDGLLEHTHFVVNDHFWSIEIKKFLQTVVTIDYATIKVVKVGGCKATARERDHRTKIWWDNWNNSKDKVGWLDASVFHTLKYFDALNQFAFFLTFGFFSLLTKIFNHLIHVDFVKNFLDGTGTHFSSDKLFIFFRKVPEVDFRNHSTFFETLESTFAA